jgi:class 3 adenylate cyclase/tetratricopeptide (TPR) repeat protein
MKCPRCQHESPRTQKFCGECGARLTIDCPSCGAANLAGQRFCGECGGSVADSPAGYTPRHLAEKILTSRAALEGERKQVTVLFADLKGSMELLAGRDPEEARKILDPVLEGMMEAVHHYEGTVNQVMGDGIMALFGAPVAHEDHAIRACYAALRMQDTLDRYSQELRRGRGVDAQIRIGLNSGEVVVRSIGSDLRMDYSAVGQTTHLAARMEQLARPGSVLLTAQTLRLVEGRMEVASQGELRVKGVAEPVAVYELKGAGAARSRLDVAAARGLSPFVGRDAELAVLADAARRAATGRGQVVALLGEPGVGKSRLILELRSSEALRDWLVLEGHATPYGKDSPYLPIIEMLGQRFELQRDDDAATIRQRVAARLAGGSLERLLSPIGALLGLPVDDREWTRLDAGQTRRLTLEALKRVLLGAGGDRPAAIVVEDLHWADAETLAALDALVDGVGAARALLIVTYRPEHRHEWSARTYYRQIAMDALTAPDAGTLLDRLLGSDRSLAPVKQLLAERTGGNPFFLEESVRNLVERRAVIGERGAYRLVRPGFALEVPATVVSVLAARIDRLEPVDKRVLQTASAIGKDVPRALLEAVADLSVDALAASLGRLQSGELLHERLLFPELEYSFRHALTHEVAYGGLTRERRRALDARIVAALEARAGLEVDRLAHHATRGELWERAVRYSRAAGHRALARHAHRAAVGYFEQAISALAQRPGDAASTALAIDLRLELRYALGPLGQYRRVFELLAEARQLAETAGDRARLGLVSCVLCNHATLRFELPEALAHGTRALDLAAALDDAALATATHAMMTLAYYLVGDHRRAAEAGRQAAQAEGDVWRERFGLVVPPPVYGPSVASWALAELGEFAEAERLAARALAAAEALEHPHSIAFARMALGIVHLRQGAPAAAAAELERAMALAEREDLPAVFLEVAGPLASAYAQAGRAPDALSLLERGVARAVELRHRLGHALRSGGMAEALLAAGQVHDAAPLAKLYVQLSRAVGTRGVLGWALRLLADAATHAEPPDVETAEPALAEALALADELGMEPLRARALLTRGELLRRLGREAEACASVADAAARFRGLGMTSWAAACDRVTRPPAA